MNKKRFLAFVMAMTMVLGSSMTAFAATGTAEDNTGNTVTGEGDVEYVDTTIYEIGLPTTATINLAVDPQGLAGLEKGATASAGDLADEAGKVTCATIPAIVNNGSVDAKVSVALTLTGDATGVTTVEAVNTGTANNVLLYAIPSAVDTPDDGGFVASSKGIVLSSSAATIDFILPKAAYVFSKDADTEVVTYVRDTNVASHGTAIQFAGLVNKNADWSEYTNSTKALGMTAVFTFTHTLDGTDVADTTDGAPYAMKAYTGDTVTLTVPDVEPTFALTGDVISWSGDSGDYAVASITDVYIKDSTTTYSALNPDDSLASYYGAGTADVSQKTITLDDTYISTWKDWGTSVDGNIYIEYVDAAGNTQTETVSFAE